MPNIPDTIFQTIFSMWRFYIAAFIVGITFSTLSAQEVDETEDLNVFWKWSKWSNPGSFLIDHCIHEADRLYALRDQEIATLQTKDDWQKRQLLVKEKLAVLFGPIPEKTPLNPRISGTLKKDGYRVEKLVFESMPGFYVAGCVFIPEGLTGKAPAILNVIGHNQEAFRAELYQLVYLNLVKKGFIVLAIDPIGQGEAVQFYDEDIGFSRAGYSVVEHCYAGNLTFLSGISLARYFAWDGIRAIDYLISRPDVDPERIGVTGFSGGGTVTTYVSALDERVKVSVPCSWSTYSRRQIETKGAQDAEANLVHGLKQGISVEDLLAVRAPKPTLMTFTSRDQYLSIQGARDAYNEVHRIYKAYDKEENLQLVEDDYKHWLTPKIRNAIYSFFMEHLGVKGDPVEEHVEMIPSEELQITPTGQARTWLKGENVQSINAKETAPLIEILEESRFDIPKHLETVKNKAMDLSGYIAPAYDDGTPFLNGRYQRDGYTVSKIAIEGEGDYVIPILLFVPDPDKKTFPAIIYLHPQGKAHDSQPGGAIEKLVKEGYVVAAVDVIGVGELRNTVTRENADDYAGVLTGQSVPAIQAGDIVCVVNYLKHHGKAGDLIGAVAINEMSIPLLHAAAFEPSISNLVFIGSITSYRSIVMNDNYNIGLVYNSDGYWHPWEIDFSWGVAGALTAYDLPDLIATLAPRKVAMAGLKNQLLEPASGQLIEYDMAFPIKVYSEKNAATNLKIVDSPGDIIPLVNWCFEK
jgi:dienelactone hydrolase